MHIHILGICGTFMGSLALLAKELGFDVSGSDANVYPPMSTQLREAGIVLSEGYRAEHLQPKPDVVVVGNAMSRGNPAIEYVLNERLPYVSGPQWLAEHVLAGRCVLAVAGTHGKTTTTSMLAWILEFAGKAPGFLIGGVPQNFSVSARLGSSDYFVIEADEYDTAFFDKRSKFVHYRPQIGILNNLEFDHADIFADVAAIQKQFHHLVRTIPANGLIIAPAQDHYLMETLQMGCWTPVEKTALHKMEDAAWYAGQASEDGSAFDVFFQQQQQARVQWSLTGQHSVMNALAAIAAAKAIGIEPAQAVAALNEFKSVKRRMEIVGVVNDVTVYDDFAHHPTAIATTLQGLRARVKNDRIIAVIEPRSNTMKLGTHRDALAQSCKDADEVCWYQPTGLGWSLQPVVDISPIPAAIFTSTAAIIEHVKSKIKAGDHVVIMSNGGFDGIHANMVEALNHA